MKRNPSPRLKPLRQRLQSLAAQLLFAPLLAAGVAMAAPVPDRLTLLVPDNADLNSWQVKVWTDSAVEEGIKIQVMTDSAFLRLSGLSDTGAVVGSNTAAAIIGGLIVPDSAHIQASDGVVAAVTAYANLGGRLMLVYDAGALDTRNFYPGSGKSRFSSLVGLDYLMYNSLGAKVAGFGQVVGTKARLESLALPPGKYLPYVAPVSLALVTTTTAFVPTSNQDPGGTLAMRATVQQRAAQAADDGSKNVRARRSHSLRKLLGIGVDPVGPVRFASRVTSATSSITKHVTDKSIRAGDWVQAVLSADLKKAKEVAGQSLAGADSTLQAISGYAYGPLNYFSFVTAGTFPGTTYLSSPEHGLVAGTRTVGSGSLLFVNMPLGYFKAIGTDSAPLHGFLNLFAREHVGMPMLSLQPEGLGGLIYNWHVDDGDDLNVDTKALLADKSKILDQGPFSIHFTAGPDVITFGDGNGMNLPGNAGSRALVRALDAKKVNHEMGSHGGWIHDYWGEQASETNEATFTTYLSQNFTAIENVIGRKLREYSSPAGNTPKWAVRWIENHGVVAYYTVGDGGASAIRPWRDGARITTNMWAVPVTPQGLYATFEEFDEHNISDAVSGQWLIDLQSFVVNQRTNRMFYNHPPGARGHLQALQPLLDRAAKLKKNGRFNWYTMAQIGDFSQRRIATTWSKSTSTEGLASFTASHPSSLEAVTWLLPRSRYDEPEVVSGEATITSDALNWAVTASSGTALRFTAPEH